MRNFKEILTQIHQAQIQTFVPLVRFREREFCKILGRKQRGLYWFWTDLSLEELEENTRKPSRQEVPISFLINQRKQLRNICNVKLEGFQVVYNGIGGYLKEPASFGLRERINQEVIGNGPTVGTLNILQNSDITRWAVSYFNFDSIENQNIVQQLESTNPYQEFGKDLEMLWRLQYGTPILCRH